MWILFPLIFLNLHVFPKESPWDAKIEAIYTQMRTTNRINQEKAKKTKAFDLKLLTINLGLLSLPVTSVPYYRERAKIFTSVMEDFIERQRPGILFIQELWHKDDFEALNELASSLEYISLISYNYENIRKRGLQILIDRNIVQEEYLHGGFWQYTGKEGPIRAWYEDLYNYERGLLYADITLNDGYKILLGNTHLTPGLGQGEIREKQLQSLTNYLKNNADPFDYIFLGGDFNLSPDLTPKGNEMREWHQNQYLYVHFNTEMKKEDFYLMDTYRTVQNDQGFTQDRSNPIAALGASTKNEPEQRLDYIWAGPAKKNGSMKLAVIYSRLIFNQPVYSKKDSADKTIQIYLSDHFGVMSTLSLFSEEDQ